MYVMNCDQVERKQTVEYMLFPKTVYIIGKECHTKSLVLHARIMCGKNIHCLRRQIKNVKRLYITKLKKILASECDSAISQIKIIINVPNGIQLCEP